MTTNFPPAKLFSNGDCELKEDAVDAGLVRGGDEILKTLVVRRILHEIHVLGIDEKDGNLLVFTEVGEVFLLDVGKVFQGDVLFEGTVALGNLPEQPVGFGVEVENQVGFGQVGGDGVEHHAEERELVGGKVVLGEEQALVDEVVAEDEVGEEVAGREHRLELLVTVHQEGHLHRQRVVLGILVEFLKERVVGKAFQHQFGVEILGQHGAEGGFARPDAALHNDVIIRYFHCSRFKVQSSRFKVSHNRANPYE